MTTNKGSNLFLSNDPQDLDHVTSEVNFVAENTDFKVIDSLPDTNKGDIGYYLFKKLPVADNFKNSLLTNHFKPNRKIFISNFIFQ